MAPKVWGPKLKEGGCKAAGGEARRSAAHAEQPADGQRVDCSADAATKAKQEVNIKSAPGVRGTIRSLRTGTN